MAKNNQPVPPKKSNNFFRSALNQVNPLNPNNFIYDKAGGFLNQATNIAPQAYAQYGANNIPIVNTNLGSSIINAAVGGNQFANAADKVGQQGFNALLNPAYLANVAMGTAQAGATASGLTSLIGTGLRTISKVTGTQAGQKFSKGLGTQVAKKILPKSTSKAANAIRFGVPATAVTLAQIPKYNKSPETLAKITTTPERPKPPTSSTTTTTPKTELPKTSTVPPVKRVPLPGAIPPRPEPPKPYVPMPYAPSTPTPSTYVAPKPTVDTRMQTYDGPTDDAGNPIYGAKDENTSSSIMAKTGNTVDTSAKTSTSTPTPFSRGTLPPDYQALAAQRDANQAALAEQTRLGLLGNADTLATSNLQTQGQFADVIGGRADSLYGMASTGNRRDFQLAQNATLAANQAGVNTLQNNYAEAMNQAQLNYQKQLLAEASKKAALAAQIRNIG